MEPIRLGIVGPGLIWENRHRPTLSKLGDLYKIAAFSATSETSRQKVEHDYPGLAFFKDYRELAAWPEIDAVVVLTPIPLNAPVALAALRAGKSVFLEKPMARTLAEGRKCCAPRGNGAARADPGAVGVPEPSHPALGRYYRRGRSASW